MLEKHFGFTHLPFRKEILAPSLFRSQGHTELSGRLRTAIQHCQIAVVTGDTGTGKSTALRAVAHGLLGSGYRFLYTSNPTLSPREMYRQWLRDLHVPPPYTVADARRTLREALGSIRETGQVAAIVVDEAHLLTPALLDDLRMLTNFEMDGASIFALVLCGHPELDAQLSSPRNQAMAQRIGMRYRLGSMTWDETKGYIGHHLQLVGVTHQLITEGAMRQTFQHSHGIARRVNRIVLRSLEMACCHQRHLVDEEMTELALAE